MLYKFIIILFCCFANSIFAQLQPVGQWRSHLSYHEAIAVVEAGNSTYFSTNLGIVEVHNIYETYFHNKVSGLSDMGIATLAFNKQYNVLIIAYQNGNIDLLYKNSDEVVNLPAVLQNNNILGAKTINHIFTEGQKVYFSCAFGLVELDLELLEFTKATFTSRNAVFSSTIFNNSLFISTQQGIFEGINDGRNLQDFNEWIPHNVIYNLPASFVSNAILNLNNELYADVNDTLMHYNAAAQSWEHINTNYNGNAIGKIYDGYPITGLFHTFNKDAIVMASNSNVFYELNADLSDLNKNFIGGVFDINQYASDTFGFQWIPTSMGMLKRNYEGTDFFIPNSLRSDRIQSMAVDNKGSLYATGATLNYQDYFFDPTGFYKYNGVDKWINYNNTTFPQLDSFQDAITVACNPRKNETFIGSFMHGIIHLRGDSIIATYNQRNTINGLQPVVGDTPRTRITGMRFDNNNNCWITNSLSANGLVLRRADGTWRNFNSPYSGRLSGIDIDRNGYKWVVQESGNLFVFSEGNLDDVTDDKYLLLNTTNSQLASANVNCVVADREGTMWVGTNNGVTIFSCGNNLFENSCTGSRPVVNPDNFNGRLLEAENVKTIAIDGNNRKWIGTDNGVFLLSEDGYEKVAFFNKDNSPLFDNSVNSIAVDGISGLIYIATNRGMLSYRSDATTGTKIADASTVYTFPNPVKADYNGIISITNLPTDANVKITDINGLLIHETYALGGQASWSGNDYTGRKAQSGVYFVFVVSNDGQQKLVTKLLFLN